MLTFVLFFIALCKAFDYVIMITNLSHGSRGKAKQKKSNVISIGYV